MTAAGTIKPARVFILGAGVAGLAGDRDRAQRLGAVVEANDVRPAVKEQVESARWRSSSTPGRRPTRRPRGVTRRRPTEDYLNKQREILTAHISNADVLITTALVPGKKAPLLVTSEMRKGMQPGSVIVDMAAGQGGNVEGSKPDETVVVDGVTIIGDTNLPAGVAADASRMYARNVLAFLGEFIDKEGNSTVDVEGEIMGAVAIVHDGQVRHEPTAKAVAN